jgi:hypothetical protein
VRKTHVPGVEELGSEAHRIQMLHGEALECEVEALGSGALWS